MLYIQRDTMLQWKEVHMHVYVCVRVCACVIIATGISSLVISSSADLVTDVHRSYLKDSKTPAIQNNMISTESG